MCSIPRFISPIEFFNLEWTINGNGKFKSVEKNNFIKPRSVFYLKCNKETIFSGKISIKIFGNSREKRSNVFIHFDFILFARNKIYICTLDIAFVIYVFWM